MDRNGSLAENMSGLANWGSSKGNVVTRPVMSSTLGIDKNVELPKFTGETFMKRAEKSAKNGELEPNKEGTAQDKKALIYATCSVNYNNPGVGEAAPTWPPSCWKPPKWPWYPVPPSAPRAACACPSRWAWTRWWKRSAVSRKH